MQINDVKMLAAFVITAITAVVSAFKATGVFEK